MWVRNLNSIKTRVERWPAGALLRPCAGGETISHYVGFTKTELSAGPAPVAATDLPVEDVANANTA